MTDLKKLTTAELTARLTRLEGTIRRNRMHEADAAAAAWQACRLELDARPTSEVLALG